MSLIPRGFWNPLVGEQRAGAAGPLSGACIDDNPLSAFLFSYLSFFFRVFFPKLLWFSLSARAIERIKRNTFRTTEKKIDEKSVFCRCDHHP
jgi:bacteriorhodopsin